MKKLKPCPECGKENQGICTLSASGQQLMYSVQCCREVWLGFLGTEEEAIKAWNDLPRPNKSGTRKDSPAMTEKKLNEIIELLVSQREKSRTLYELGIDAYEINDELHKAIDILLETQFKEKNEILSWYIHEDPDPPVIYEYIHGEDRGVRTSTRDKISYDFRKKGDLWRYLND